jgi:taurine dioxygenase
MTRLNLEVRRVAGALGAEIHGVDLATRQSDATIAAIRELLLEHGVIFFRDQRLDDAKLKNFAGRFGSFFRHPYFLPEGDPDVIVVRRAPGDQRIVGEGWHSDTPAVAAPPMASLLYGEDVPPYGGDTLFANQYLAYETLSPGMRNMLEGVRAVYSDTRFAGATAGRNAISATKSREDAAFAHSLGVHPVVRTHPETGRKALYVVRPLMVRFDGMTEAESDGLAEFLYDHSHRPEFTCRFRWAPGSLAFWDNRCTQHAALNDTGPFHRVMRRVQLVGDIPA